MQQIGNEMSDCYPIKTYETQELKLAGLLLASIEEASFTVLPAEVNSRKKTIKISYPLSAENEVQDLIGKYIERRATVNLYAYNRALNPLRDALNADRKTTAYYGKNRNR